MCFDRWKNKFCPSQNKSHSEIIRFRDLTTVMDPTANNNKSHHHPTPIFPPLITGTVLFPSYPQDCFFHYHYLPLLPNLVKFSTSQNKFERTPLRIHICSKVLLPKMVPWSSTFGKLWVKQNLSLSFAAGHFRAFNMLVLRITHFLISLTMDVFSCAIVINISVMSCRERSLFWV